MWQYKSNFISIFLNQYFIIIDFDAKLDFTNRAIKIRKIDIFKDNPEPFVLIIPPSVTGGDGPPGSPGGIVSETFSNNGTNKKQNKNNENNELSEIMIVKVSFKLL